MKKNKIPGSIIAFLVLLIVFVIILIALVVPTITKLPKYNEDHATISAQIADCDDVLANQSISAMESTRAKSLKNALVLE